MCSPLYCICCISVHLSIWWRPAILFDPEKFSMLPCSGLETDSVVTKCLPTFGSSSVFNFEAKKPASATWNKVTEALLWTLDKIHSLEIQSFCETFRILAAPTQRNWPVQNFFFGPDGQEYEKPWQNLPTTTCSKLRWTARSKQVQHDRVTKLGNLGNWIPTIFGEMAPDVRMHKWWVCEVLFDS